MGSGLADDIVQPDFEAEEGEGIAMPALCGFIIIVLPLRSFSLCWERLFFVELFLFIGGSIMRFFGECCPLLGVSTMENPGYCGALGTRTNGRGRKFSLAGGEGKALRRWLRGGFLLPFVFDGRILLLFLGEERGMRSFLEGEIEQWEHWQGCIG